jgi:uroporphyrinogen decarboxylase
MMNNFYPDYRQIEKVLHNQRPERLPLYKHHIDDTFIEKVLGKEIVLGIDAAKEIRRR